MALGDKSDQPWQEELVDGIGRHDQRVDSARRDSGETRFGILAARRERQELDTELACRLPHLRNFLLRPNIGLAPKGSHHADFRDGLLQQGEPFRAVRPILKCDTRDVPARSRKARGKPGANGIAGEANDRNSRCRLLRRKTDRRAGGHQNIDFERKKLGDEGWNAIRVTIRVSRLDRYGLSDHISFVGEALGDPGEIARIRAARADPDISNPRIDTCWARARRGKAEPSAANAMNSRRLIRSPRRRRRATSAAE